jgi:hypothetical protein
LFVIACGCSLGAPVLQASLVYNVTHPPLPDGFGVSGTFTVADTAPNDRLLSQSEIEAFSITLDFPSQPSFTFSSVTHSFTFFREISISPTQLYLTPSSTAGIRGFVLKDVAGENTVELGMRFFRRLIPPGKDGSPGENILTTDFHMISVSSAGNDTVSLQPAQLIIASRDAAPSVPEPASIVMLSLGGIGMGLAAWRRRRLAVA